MMKLKNIIQQPKMNIPLKWIYSYIAHLIAQQIDEKLGMNIVKTNVAFT